ncbi:MAG: hypothetical protein HRU19_18155 [Pseudobacteriovorax sp.]|nr:hypothetical protein [Pseudobacteriovorax sp.]
MTDQKPKEFVNQEECDELAKAMDTKYRIAMNSRNFSIQAIHDGPVVSVKVLLANGDESFYYPVEGRVEYEKEELTAYEAALFLVDYIDNYFEEFLLEEEEDLFLPIDWSAHSYESVNFHLKGQVHNKKLDDLADRILAEGAPVEIH